MICKILWQYVHFFSGNFLGTDLVNWQSLSISKLLDCFCCAKLVTVWISWASCSLGSYVHFLNASHFVNLKKIKFISPENIEVNLGLQMTCIVKNSKRFWTNKWPTLWIQSQVYSEGVRGYPGILGYPNSSRFTL